MPVHVHRPFAYGCLLYYHHLSRDQEWFPWFDIEHRFEIPPMTVTGSTILWSSDRRESCRDEGNVWPFLRSLSPWSFWITWRSLLPMYHEFRTAVQLFLVQQTPIVVYVRQRVESNLDFSREPRSTSHDQCLWTSLVTSSSIWLCEYWELRCHQVTPHPGPLDYLRLVSYHYLYLHLPCSMPTSARLSYPNRSKIEKYISVLIIMKWL